MSDSAPRVLVLLSGGLDSLLVAAQIERAGLPATWIHFKTGFQRASAVNQLKKWAAGRLDGVSRDLAFCELEAPYLAQVVKPELDRNGSRQPCVECRGFLLAEAKRLADDRGLRWIATGDVVGQSHPAQGRPGFDRVDARAGLSGRVLRPLSGRFLGMPDGFPEPYASQLAGALQGRARRDQLKLAQRHQLQAVAPHQGGCCLLAEPRFRQRLRDDLEHEKSVCRGEADREAVARLALGRHFRLGWNLKVVVSRNAEEGEWLAQDRAATERCRVAEGVGSEVAVFGPCEAGQRERVARFAAYYSKQRGAPSVTVAWSDGRKETVDGGPIDELDLMQIPPQK